MLEMPTTQPSRDSVPYWRVGMTWSRSAMEEDWKAAGLPLVQAKSARSMSAKEANGAPDAFWHIRQWQMLIFAGAADTAKRTAPHWQPPVRTDLVASAM